MESILNELSEILHFVKTYAEAQKADVWKVEEDYTQVRRKAGVLSWSQGRREYYLIRWRDRNGAVHFLYSREPKMHEDMIFQASVEKDDLILAGPRINKVEVPIYDPFWEMIPVYDRYSSLPEEVVEYEETLRRNFYANSSGMKGHYRETLFRARYNEGIFDFDVFARRFEEISKVESVKGSNKGRIAVFHPKASFKLFLAFLERLRKGTRFNPPAEVFLYDDPSIPYGTGSFPFDSGGFAPFRISILKEGKIHTSSPHFYVRTGPEEFPGKNWANLKFESPFYHPERFIVIYDLQPFPNFVLAFSSGGELRLDSEIALFKGFLGKYKEGWYIGKPFIKSDFLVFDLNKIKLD